ncbi:MAG: Ig-like domain-containing protein [Lentimicrobium sp.]|jgi:hypothetical protein|nr:Ig-like domain-containing protein [Lentimicrobium sp.]MDD2527333.1 Ig-like domain-containing protein [Lentimicrobiaceae bacterium]MDD4597186.1 Ig-like domain-containing protein [Lentimicrobiaceae bacterium]MDY0025380.1 Ig-like domain-containing protein [Lentimicrobium sp.]
MNERFWKYIIGLIVALTAWSCANPVAPTGGPKDVQPPEVVITTPANGSVWFEGTKLAITFNEFVQIKDLNNQMIISPPLREIPDVLLRGKTLHLTFKEALRPHSTYNIFFGKGIVDLTEGNALKDYTFSFSTGAVLDSLAIEGKVLDAFNLAPVKDTYVMLYDSVYDSVPYLSRPYYLARTGEDGSFRLHNLKQGNYLLFALGDKNNNYLFDLPTEPIAFIDSLIQPRFKATRSIIISDTIHHDTISHQDTLDHMLADSLEFKYATDSEPAFINYTLYQFLEADSIQRLLKPSLLRQNVVNFAFRYPVKELSFKPLNTGFLAQWNLMGYNSIGDTVTLWIPEPGADTLSVEITDNNTILDTVQIALKPATRGRPGRQTETVVVPKLSFKNSLSSLKIKPERPLILTFNDPVSLLDTSKLILLRDSLVVVPEIRFTDSLHRRLAISHPWNENHKYRLTALDSAFIDIFGHGNDSTALAFTTYKESETGLIQLKIKLPPDSNISYIIQLLGPKQVLVEQRTIHSDTTLTYNYLVPKIYGFKVIYDRNRNGRWDSGNYLRKIQPEKVAFFPKEFELRANWTMEEEWNLEEETP